ncbi:hypothetical protein BJ944DRAFT_202018 [Cunninghamella echinulata]|nr:hypothetical protein BJ944DRAFT_202018 [Cunninghamella echinulata]
MVKFSICLVAALSLASSIQALPTTLQKRGIRTGVLETCINKNDVALTFDDGPFQYTSSLIDFLVKEKVKATFFVNGNNWWVEGDQKKIAPVIKKAYNAGFEIASHTYTHPDLAKLSNSAIKKELQNNEKTIYNAIKKYPAVIRPPFGSVNDRVVKLLNSYGYSIVNWSIDTKDTWEGVSVTQQYNYVNQELSKPRKAGHIILAHDVQKKTSQELAPKLVKLIKSKKLRFVTVSECLGVDAYKTKKL